MNVKFFPTLYIPTPEKMAELNKMQELIHFTRIEYLYQLRNDSPRMRAARIYELHKMYRARWKLILGDNEKISLQESSSNS